MQTRRVVITGLGIVCSVGNNCQEVTQSLREGKSGVVFVPEYEELGFRSRVHVQSILKLTAWSIENPGASWVMALHLTTLQQKRQLKTQVFPRSVLPILARESLRVGRGLHGKHSSIRGTSPKTGDPWGQSLFCTTSNVEYELGYTQHFVKHSGHKLFSKFRLFHQCTLHWKRDGTDSDG